VTRRAKSPAVVIVSICLAALAIPALAWASGAGGTSSGGGGMGPGPGGSTGPSPHAADVQESATASGITITTQASAILAGQLAFSGSVPSSDAGDVVEIERSGHQTGWTWAPTAQTTVNSDGSFSATWQINHIGQFAVRAVLTHNGQASAASGWPTVTVTVYRPSIATQYGPGFYGQRTACGRILRRQTVGVANRTLPCGTKVAIYYQGRSMVVPVIDRGPYAHNGADWDLTMAAGRALGIPGTARIGAVSLPRPSAG
jgi:rare lipoprotein A